MTDPVIPQILRGDIDPPTYDAGRRPAVRDGLPGLPALDPLHNPLSIKQREPRILMHVHPVLFSNLNFPGIPTGHDSSKGLAAAHLSSRLTPNWTDLPEIRVNQKTMVGSYGDSDKSATSVG